MDGHVRQELFARMQNNQKINHFPGLNFIIKGWEFFQEKITLVKI